MRRRFQNILILLDQRSNQPNGLRKTIKLRFCITFRRLDHQTKDFRKSNGRRMIPEVEKEFSDARNDVRTRNSCRFNLLKKFFRKRNNKFVHPWSCNSLRRQKRKARSQLVSNMA